MRERLNYGGQYYDDHEENLDDDDGSEEDYTEGSQEKVDPRAEYHVDSSQEEFGHRAEYPANGPQEEVAYEAKYSPGDSAESDYADVQFGWRSKARRGKRGRRWAPPNTRTFTAPVFVRLADLQSHDHS